MTRGSCISFEWENEKPASRVPTPCIKEIRCNAYSGKKRIGFIFGYENTASKAPIILDTVEVVPSFRRKGVATLLLQRFLEKYGADRVIELAARAYGRLVDRIPQWKLVSFYENWGFELDDPEDLHYGMSVRMTRPKEHVQAVDKNLSDYRMNQIRKSKILKRESIVMKRVFE